MIERDADLSGANTLALPARAERLARPDSEAALAGALATRGAGEPLFVLGQGSNIVLDGDLPGLTLIPSLGGIDYREQGDDTARVTVGAGVVWDTLVADTVARGWRGLENLSLIPGTAGAAPFQNIGAYGVELADVLESVDTLAVADGRSVRFAAADCEFDYRDSLFKSRRRGEFIITGITLTLRRHGPCRVDYGGLAARFADADPASLDPAMVRQAVIEQRQSKLPDPAVLPNAGSFFKNPVVSVAHHHRLKADWPELVAFPHRDGMKLAAGWLIERAGWKGRRLGPVGMHRDQALVLVNHGGARAADVRALAAAVRADVRKRFAVDLEQEPVVLP
ncbi:UDP-N-acetylenolpyruvoylglucosamine reductase [Alcanivorax sp. 521-1]|uniref:UDP-N-acetylenolpyruvoylglucosamine reductase n=1 Tax=Alloalcanivorax profundimaris TaxID=2735259 RepID=A0ABS0AVU5_9GAMM|nr:UDP-N-acetylmuramate dehydrogenase [Alloalcanivorax profundimaris]MBF5058264.1 UDP-N-acetylenolpyruvoylglucosamine reductase [Alloalcanivorax profundimaris]